MLGMGPEEIATVIVGAATALTVLLGGRKAKQQIQNKPETQSGMVEVAGALISGEDARALSREFRANIDENVHLRGEIILLRKALHESNELGRALIRSMDDMERAVQGLIVEMARGARK